MPIPDTTDVGTLIRFFKKDKPEWSHNRHVAAAINTAKRNRAAQSMNKEAGLLAKGAAWQQNPYRYLSLSRGTWDFGKALHTRYFKNTDQQ